ncbi:MAG: carboxypeptidase regulatory-like domain-containing protein [Smithella sp.]|nr:carboxypeptidase regulatory-like domain-containing protein [Smithella sp.]
MIKRGLFARALGTLLAMLLLFLGCSGNQDIPPRTYSISGNVYENFFDLPDVEMILSGDASRTTKTDKDGKYSFTGLANGNYRVTPKFESYFFTPASVNITINGANVADVNFYGENQDGDYSIAGKVVLSGGVSGLEGVTVALRGDANRTMTTDNNGEYEFAGLGDGSYTVTPSLKNHAFTPINSDITVNGADKVVGNFTATLIPTATYNQSELTGIWNLFFVHSEEWKRIVLSIESDGTSVYEDYEDSQGSPNPGSEGLILTIDADGIIGGFMTMASNKKMMAGTLGGLIIALKAGGVFNASDLDNTSFVYHLLKAGAVNEWRYGAGTIDADGNMNINSETTSGATPVTGVEGQITVSSDGVVTLDTHDTFKGFLSDDKKTVVATETVGDSYVLWVIQITNDGKVYNLDMLDPSIAHVHIFAGSATNAAPLPAYWMTTTFNGTMVSNNNINFSAPDPSNPSVDASGVVAIPGDANHGDTHGQLSHDEKFIVGTKTLYKDSSPFGYAMVVYTIK